LNRLSRAIPLLRPALPRLRPIRAADKPALRQTCFPGYSAAEIDQAVGITLTQAGAGCGVHLVAEWDGNIVGSGQLVPWGQNAEIANLVVAPEFRRRGIGRALLTALIDAARERGYRMVEIGAETDNEAALSLYRRLGFVDSRTIRLRSDGAERALIYLARVP
jgi:ribosomal protein S18 acetylase RimI-like enzyme